MTAERRATHTYAGAVGAVFVYGIRTCAEFIIPGILEAKKMIQKYKGDTKIYLSTYLLMSNINQDLGWSNATCICSAIRCSLLFLRVAMRLSHDTSTPFPANHSLSTSNVIFSGSPRKVSLMLTILFPRSSCRRNVPKELNCFPTREGKLISSSCGKVGLSLTTVNKRKRKRR